jgi:hypothetical protein
VSVATFLSQSHHIFLF